MKWSSPRVFSRVPALLLVLCVVSAMAFAQQDPKANAASATQSKEAKTAAPPATETMDANDPLFGVPPMPKGKVSLVGGTVQKIDRVRNRVTVKPFGGGQKMTLGFDERTHIYRDGRDVTERGIQRGDRVYVDTMLDGAHLFARNIRVVTQLVPADARGQIVTYDARRGVMTMQDDLSSTPVTFRITHDTAVKDREGAADNSIDLVPGSLVAVRFSPDRTRRDVAQEISILAVPGANVMFIGKVRHLDLRSGTLAVENQTDNKTYELRFEPGLVGDNVMVGSDVTVSAVFEGKGYRAKSISVNAQ